MKRVGLLVVITTLIGCNGFQVIPERLDVIGTVLGVQSERGSVTFFVNGKPAEHLTTTEAKVRVTSKTRVVLANGTEGRASDIRDGQRVAVTFDGPVMESYPVQASAGFVRILR